MTNGLLLEDGTGNLALEDSGILILELAAPVAIIGQTVLSIITAGLLAVDLPWPVIPPAATAWDKQASGADAWVVKPPTR